MYAMGNKKKKTQAHKLTAVIDFYFYLKGSTQQLQNSHTAWKNHSVFTNVDKYLLILNNTGDLLDTHNREKLLRLLKGRKSVF